MTYYRLFPYFLFAIFLVSCPKPQSEKDGETNQLINLIVMYNDGVFNPKEYFCRNTIGTITNDQVVNTNTALGIKKFPGQNGTSLELTLADGSGCHVRVRVYYCDFFDNAFVSPPDNSGSCGIGDIVSGNGNQLLCTVIPSSYYRYALNVIPEDNTNQYANCNYSIKLTDF